MSMSEDKLRSALLACEAIIAKQAAREGVTMAIRDGAADSQPRRVSHMLWLARNGLNLVQEGRREKAMRWLGFLQGALWAQKLVTVDELKDMNRPDDSEPDPDRV